MSNNQTNIENTLNDDEIDVKPILRTLKRGRKFLITIPLLTSITVAIISLIETPVWRGNFQIVISDNNEKLSNVSKLFGLKSSGGLNIKTQEALNQAINF